MRSITTLGLRSITLATPGGTCTLSVCRVFRRPHLVVLLDGTPVHPSHVVEWIRTNSITVLSVAGNRESSALGIGARAERILQRVFARVGEGRCCLAVAPTSGYPESRTVKCRERVTSQRKVGL